MFLRKLYMSVFASGTYPNGRKCYSGRYKNGEAVYFYDDSPDGRVYRGRYWYKRLFYDNPFGKRVETAQGTFADNKKDGHWRYESKTYGLSMTLCVDYVEGMRRGAYSYKSVCSSRSLGYAKGHTELSVGMYDDHPVGVVTFSFGNEHLTGCYDNDGQPHGQWKLDLRKTDSCRTDYEEWEHGECISAYSIDESTGAKKDIARKLPNMVADLIRRECDRLEKM